MQRAFYGALYGRLDANAPRFLNYGLAPVAAEAESHPEPLQATLALEVLRAGRAALGRDPRVMVDVACGRGGALALAAGMFADAALLGLDAQPDAARVARSGRVLAAVGDGLSLPLRDGCADLVTSLEAMLNIGRGLFLIEAARVLAPGGVLAGCGSFAGPPSRVVELIREEAARAGLVTLRWRDLTAGVVAACRADAERRAALVPATPRVLRARLADFAALPGSPTFRAYESGARCYYLGVWRKG